MQGSRQRDQQKRKRQRPKPLALSSLTISQREWIPSPAFRRPTLPACAEYRVLRRCLWLASSLRWLLPLWLFRRPGVRLAPPACTLRSVRPPGSPDSRRLPWLPASCGLASQLSSGARIPRHHTVDRLPGSSNHFSSDLASGQLPACALHWVRLLLQRFMTDLLLVHQLDRH